MLCEEIPGDQQCLHEKVGIHKNRLSVTPEFYAVLKTLI